MPKIKDVMCPSPQFLPSTATLQEAAQKMIDLDCGFLPIGDGDQLVGTLTDRDITTRATAKGLPPSTKVSQVMTKKVLYCAETDTTESIAQNMAENEVRRLVVLNNRADKRLVGVVSLADIVNASSTSPSTSHALIKGVSAPSSQNKKAKKAA